MTWAWSLLALALIAVAWWALKIILALAVPHSVTGTALLKKELSARGVPSENLSPAFYADCIAWAERVAQAQGRGSSIKWKASFVESIETLANMAQLWLREPDSPMFQQYGDSPNSYREIFERHKVGSTV